MLKKLPWQDICKFLSGAFFVSAGVLFYLYQAHVSVPLLGTSFIAPPELSGGRSIVHTLLFVTCFYLGFLRKWTSKTIPKDYKDTKTNREIVLAFYQQGLIAMQPRLAFERYASPDFIEHKPDMELGTREATIRYLEQLMTDLPGAMWEVVRTVAEEEHVVLHARFTPAKGASPYAIADIFRIDGGLIVEHWDVVAPPSPVQHNPNSRF